MPQIPTAETEIDIRAACDADQDALYDIVLKTGLSGGDATALYQDPKMLGHIYTAPYVALAPELAFVATLGAQVVGYVCGVADTRRFEAQMEADWWPALRAQYQDPDPTRRDAWTKDESRCHFIHHPQSAPAYVAEAFPAHMHMNLTSEARGCGLGRRLFDHWMDAARGVGVGPVHIGANPGNTGGIAFWGRMGFQRLLGPDCDVDPRTCWMGRL
ncbi:GNAT family N-acetyltransferase [Shimia sp. NS0008-38b]|uniref:GNAT family N-acetyltransferase n=1 Tax=Shimia sp. NS0008-38b TaxID=3127653 RepID=UPI0031034F7C